MPEKDEWNCLYLIWEEPNSKCKYTIGRLSKNSQYEFSYVYEINEAIDKGFELLIPFQDISKAYKSDRLFPIFASRLPDPKRKDIGKILKKYGLKEYDDYELLKRSGAKLPIDSLKFIAPALERADNKNKN